MLIVTDSEFEKRVALEDLELKKRQYTAERTESRDDIKISEIDYAFVMV